jgi:hypothetical protein
VDEAFVLREDVGEVGPACMEYWLGSGFDVPEAGVAMDAYRSILIYISF